MYHHLIIKVIFLITYLNVISSNPVPDDCYTICDANDKKSVCVMDKNSVCFEKFPSECVMENVRCLFEKDFMIMDATYCELEGFQCNDKPWPKFQSPPVDETHLYSYNENPRESVEIVFKNDNDSDDMDNHNKGDENHYDMINQPPNDNNDEVNDDNTDKNDDSGQSQEFDKSNNND